MEVYRKYCFVPDVVDFTYHRCGTILVLLIDNRERLLLGRNRRRIFSGLTGRFREGYSIFMVKTKSFSIYFVLVITHTSHRLNFNNTNKLTPIKHTFAFAL